MFWNKQNFTVVFLAISIALASSFVISQASQEPPKFKIENNRLVLPKPIIFATGSDAITKESEDSLQYVVAFLNEKTSLTLVRIESHTDNAGVAEINQTLTEKRALVVAKWLVAHGADCHRLLPVGFGAAKPVASNETPDGRAQNRRIEIAMAELRGRAIGGMPADGGGKIAGKVCPETK